MSQITIFHYSKACCEKMDVFFIQGKKSQRFTVQGRSQIMHSF